MTAVSFDFQAAYDELNSADDDYRFYASLAQELGASRVLDLGCGTGVLARLLARNGHAVVGIDPDPDMLRVARDQAGADQVDWRLGYSDSADTGGADLAVMTGHVAQVFVEDSSWRTALTNLHRALAPAGVLAFETRNPAARGWEAWTREATMRTVVADEGSVEFWHETAEVNLPRIAYDTFTRNLSTGEETRTRNLLAFRDREALKASLRDTGFEVTEEIGDWSRAPVTETSPEVVVTARRL
jgi:SAM-dependent methyltransferase